MIGSVDTGEMPQNGTFHEGLHHLLYVCNVCQSTCLGVCGLQRAKKGNI